MEWKETECRVGVSRDLRLRSSKLRGGNELVWSSVFRPFELDFKAFHADLEAIHGLDGRLCCGWVVEADESEALALVGRPINEHFGTDHVPERQKHLHQFRVPEFLRQMIDEQVATVRSLPLRQLFAMKPPARPSQSRLHILCNAATIRLLGLV